MNQTNQQHQPLTQAQIDKRVDDMVERCRASGLKMTQQRIVLFAELLRSGMHLSAEQLYERVRGPYPTLSLSTVYNTLETLARLDVIGVVQGLDGPSLYDPEPAPHHHFVCRETGVVLDLMDEDAIAIDRSALAAKGMAVDGVRLILYGKLSPAGAS